MGEPVPISEVAFPPIVNEPLDPAWDLGLAAQHIVLTHFRQLLQQRQVVIDNVDLEGVHEIRVAARRTRTALQTFSSLWDTDILRRFARYLERFATEFGIARDLDVMIIYLREQQAKANGERAAALTWLLERNVGLRAAEQHKLHQVLLQFEHNALPAAFVAYFSGVPVDLWSLGVQHG